jgi:LysM repeat protein
MSGKPPIAATIAAYRKKRQKKTPFIFGAIALLLVVVGAIFLVVGFASGGGFRPLAAMFATPTSTPSITPSPTSTSTPTETPTITSTPTETPTPTPAAPYSYVVQEGDYLGKILTDHGLTTDDLLLILILNPYRGAALENSIDPNTQIVYVGQRITLPPPGMTMPTATSVPPNAPRGTRITYFVLPGDSLGGIANRFNSTVDDIVAANKERLPDGAATVIFPGWTLIVPINIVTPVPSATNTP